MNADADEDAGADAGKAQSKNDRLSKRRNDKPAPMKKEPVQKEPVKREQATEEHDRLAEPVDHEEQPRLPYPVVGIGGSAGGIEAFLEFFSVMPSDSGMAFVLIQHLPPERESMMAELIAKKTKMRVEEVRDGIQVHPNHIYVIRPGRTLTIHQGKLHLGEPLEKPGHRRPIDDFFRSLAEEQRHRSIIILMSGMGSNGSAGAQAIKAVGGVCIAQDPDSAKFPSMPRHLIEAGHADFVLRIAEMPDILQRYATHPYTVGPATEGILLRDAEYLKEIMAVLRTRVRHDFTGYKKPTVMRRIQRRMSLNQLTKLADYTNFLRTAPTEVTALADDLLIHVTGFFRDAEAWEALRDRVVKPLMLERESGTEIRCWVTACASGEEAYTLAMVLNECADLVGKAFDIKVFSTDAADRMLVSARQGVYPGGIESEMPQERLEQFFDRDDAVYRIKKSLREQVVFAPQNLLHDPPFSRIDIITCRNMLIYLEPDLQHRVLALLHFGLREGGALFLGNSESVAGAEELFEPIDKHWRIYRRLGPTRHGALDFHPIAGPRLHDAALERTLPRTSIAQITHRLLLDEHTPPAVTIDRQQRIVYYHGATDLFLNQPRGEPTRELLMVARETVRGALRVAVGKAIADDHEAVATDGIIDTKAGPRRVVVAAKPLGKLAPGYYLVSFVLQKDPEPAPLTLPPGATGDQAMMKELQRVRDELQSTLEEVQTSNEELKASNEEATSINEELQSTNEELETSKEEMQSLNEELSTLNAQLQAKMLEQEATSNDLASLLASTDIAVLFLDTKFRIRRYTAAVRDLLEVIPSDVGRPLSDLALKFKDPGLIEDARAVIEKLVPIAREVRSESSRHYVRRVLPYRTSDNRIEGIVITFLDITESKQMQAHLVRSEERLRRVLHSDTVGVAFFDAEDVITDANEQFTKMTGLPREKMAAGLVRWPMLPAPGEPTQRMKQALQEFRGSGRIPPYETQFRRPDGTTWWGLLMASRIAEQESVAHVLDVTERKLMQLERDHLLVLTSDLIAVVSARDGVWRRINRALNDLLGTSDHKLVDQPLLDRFHSDDRARAHHALAAASASKPSDSKFEARVRGEDGGYRWIAWEVSPVPGEDLVYFIGRDVSRYRGGEAAATENARAAQQAMDTAHRLTEQFIAMLSHELRTPVSSIMLWAKMLQQMNLKPEQRAEGIAVIERSAQTQARLLDDLLDTARITSGKLRLELRPTDFCAVVRSVVEANSPAAIAKGVEVKSDCENAGTVLVDPERLRQIVWNLLTNAVKFTSSGGHVRVVVRRHGNDIELRVDDDGAGIDPAFLPHLFNHFTQGVPGAQRKHGLGLGLAITRYLVEAHGGSIRASSAGLDRGSEFVVRIPLPKLPERGKSQEAEAQPFAPGSLRGQRVLLIEDDTQSRAALGMLLREAGAVVDEFPSAEPAFDWFQSHPPDLILSDLSLPQEDGCSLLRRIRAAEAAARRKPVPAIALTGMARPQDQHDALTAGFQRHIAKPLTPEQLFEAITEVMRARG